MNENKNIERRYKFSILIDQIIFVVPLIITIIFVYKDFAEYTYLMKSVVNLGMTVWVLILFFSDIVFFGRSIGKRIAGIEIIQANGNYNFGKSLIYRRLLDLFNKLLIGKSFSEKCQYIESKTNTIIKVKCAKN
jgi:uncharacterized RDD family membrane protein YckC